MAVLVLAIAAILSLSPALLAAQETSRLQLNEQAIKAGLVYNFLKYTTWPENAAFQGKGRLRVCLFGRDPLTSYLSPLEGQTAQQAVITLVRKTRISELEDCSMVFVDPSQKNSLPQLLAFLGDRHALTVSDMEQFASMGGMVELTVEDKRVVLYVNGKAVNRAGLSIQDRLLKLAKPVSG
jgi:hypothetical protein